MPKYSAWTVTAQNVNEGRTYVICVHRFNPISMGEAIEIAHEVIKNSFTVKELKNFNAVGCENGQTAIIIN